MIRFFIFLLLAYLIYRAARSWFRSIVDTGDHEQRGTEPQEAELIQDPQCGTYFLKQRGVTANINGQVTYFCSKACRDKYLVDKR